jgi:hypothetical protein
VSVRCKAQPLGGGQCQLEVGHEGRHRKVSYPFGPDGRPFVFDWDSESQQCLADRHSSRCDG